MISRRPTSALLADPGTEFLVMGVVNVTPDSFSDGGHYLDPEAAVAHGLRHEAEGAAILDVGGESTRPGALPVRLDEELRRVLPVLEGLATACASAKLSVDTSKADVAARALAAGATFVNDVTALRADPGMASVVAAGGIDCCLMHMLGDPRTMQADPCYKDVVDDIKAFLEERLRFAVGEGIAEERIVLDPGIGFGKTVAHNLELLRRIDELVALGRPVLIGSSRKSFIGGLTGREVDERLAGTIATNVLAYAGGARIFRVHDVAPVRDALTVAAATVRRRWTARASPASSTT
ncbi:MAG: dihydropteroate synthase [Solirubrobacteraceae bacterium]